MINWIRDLPDWATGPVAAGTLWFSVSYVVLAPRAMEQHAKAEIAPSCIAMLEEEQERAMQLVQDSISDDQERAENKLLHMERQLAFAEEAANMMRQSGLNTLMQGLGINSNGLNGSNVQTLRAQVENAKSALARVPDISNLRVPSSELLKTCTCAAIQAAAGMRTSYAISLASFRLIDPTDVGDVAKSAMSIVDNNTCGGKPWEKLL